VKVFRKRWNLSGMGTDNGTVTAPGRSRPDQDPAISIHITATILPGRGNSLHMTANLDDANGAKGLRNDYPNNGGSLRGGGFPNFAISGRRQPDGLNGNDLIVSSNRIGHDTNLQFRTIRTTRST